MAKVTRPKLALLAHEPQSASKPIGPMKKYCAANTASVQPSADGPMPNQKPISIRPGMKNR